MATLSQDLIDLIPGSLTSVLENVTGTWRVLINDDGHNNYSINGTMAEVTLAKQQLETLLGRHQQNKPSTGIQTDHQHTSSQTERKLYYDKSVSCDILKPIFSRSGRQLKQKSKSGYVDEVDMDHIMAASRVKKSKNKKTVCMCELGFNTELCTT